MAVRFSEGGETLSARVKSVRDWNPKKLLMAVRFSKMGETLSEKVKSMWDWSPKKLSTAVQFSKMGETVNERVKSMRNWNPKKLSLSLSLKQKECEWKTQVEKPNLVLLNTKNQNNKWNSINNNNNKWNHILLTKMNINYLVGFYHFLFFSSFLIYFRNQPRRPFLGGNESDKDIAIFRS